MNDAMTSISAGQLNALNLWRNFFHGKFGDGVEAGEGVSNRLLESSKIDAPALISAGHFGFDFWISDLRKISPGVYPELGRRDRNDNTLSLRALRPFDVAQGHALREIFRVFVAAPAARGSLRLRSVFEMTLPFP
jgi:hypothetical protein